MSQNYNRLLATRLREKGEAEAALEAEAAADASERELARRAARAAAATAERAYQLEAERICNLPENVAKRAAAAEAEAAAAAKARAEAEAAAADIYANEDRHTRVEREMREIRERVDKHYRVRTVQQQ